MRICVLSDLHNEFTPFMPPKVDADVIVLAGDIGLGTRGVRWAASAFLGTPVLYVAGNHEYYGHAIPKLTVELVSLGAELGVTVLERAATRIDAFRFLGCTLWSDFRVTGNQAASMAACHEAMTDFRKIRVSPSFRRLRPSDQAGWHDQALRWLRSELANGDAARTVVVTHHAPSRHSLGPEFSLDPLSGGYASDLESLIATSGVPLWIHGHTHRCADYFVGGTRVLSNPRGYPDEPVSGFMADAVAQIEA